MAPIKFEEDMREKLEKRTIEPSSNAWGKLSQQLEAENKKQNRKGYWWLGAAASVIGVLFVMNAYFNSDATNGTSTVVNVEDVAKPEESKEELKNNKVEKESLVKIEIAIDLEDKNEQEKIEVKAEEAQYLAKVNTVEEGRKRNKTTKDEQNKIEEDVVSNEPDANDEIQKNNKIETVLMEVAENTNAVTDSDIDALLKQAEQSMATKESRVANKEKLDYNDLLNEVEDDLEESFRDKLLKTVKDGYHSVKSYVAERND